MNKADIIKNALCGSSLINFTAVENSLRSVGECMDEISNDVDGENILDISNKMLIKLMSMKVSLDTYIEETKLFLDMLKEDKE